MINNKEFGQKLKKLRGNMSQEEFACKIGVDRSVYAKFESGLRVPTIKFILMVYNATNVSADWLLGVQRSEKLKTERFMGAVSNLDESHIGYAISRGLLKEWCEIMKSDFMSIFHSAEDIKDE